ncbi:MAG: hypothetical protein J0I42_18165 [Bosea sp.]|uniref:hypothetical protein n=1 Tax=Bosea sp. (in: a-proteobacteria) TaxID=1871050 RepID=UPI001ACC7605|nr:hypothetical protein [Bosea sp. (in: a-proteobacteria)]MBN9453868.1 hypothetical protein [Bosea sp. (in: a-proteobacteria)]
MSPIRINHHRSKGKPIRRTYGVKPVSLPTFSFYGHLPVVFVDGELVVGRRVIPLEPRR